MSNNVDAWELLEEARMFVAMAGYATESLARIDAALAARKADGQQTCEFCKGVGHVPEKRQWSPQDVLGPDKGNNK